MTGAETVQFWKINSGRERKDRSRLAGTILAWDAYLMRSLIMQGS